MTGIVPRFSSSIAAEATSVGPIIAAMVFETVMEFPYQDLAQLRVLPLWTRPLLAGRSLLDFGGLGGPGRRVSRR
jgi:hypothetical protein